MLRYFQVFILCFFSVWCLEPYVCAIDQNLDQEGNFSWELVFSFDEISWSIIQNWNSFDEWLNLSWKIYEESTFEIIWNRKIFTSELVNGVVVKVETTDDVFNKDTFLSVKPMNLLASEILWIDDSTTVLTFDITLFNKGSNWEYFAVEPSSPVKITFNYSDNIQILEALENHESVILYHSNDLESMAERISTVSEKNQMTIETTHFSPYYFVIWSNETVQEPLVDVAFHYGETLQKDLAIATLAWELLEQPEFPVAHAVVKWKKEDKTDWNFMSDRVSESMILNASWNCEPWYVQISNACVLNENFSFSVPSSLTFLKNSDDQVLHVSADNQRTETKYGTLALIDKRWVKKWWYMTVMATDLVGKQYHHSIDGHNVYLQSSWNVMINMNEDFFLFKSLDSEISFISQWTSSESSSISIALKLLIPSYQIADQYHGTLVFTLYED